MEASESEEPRSEKFSGRGLLLLVVTGKKFPEFRQIFVG